MKRFYRPKFLHKLSNLKYYFLHRFIWRSHMFHVRGIRKGTYYDTDVYMFHALFSMLVDYVEIECAHMNRISFRFRTLPDTEMSSEQLLYNITPWFDRLINRAKWNERLGLDYLNWEIALGDESPRQSNAAKQIKELYEWYKYERPNRPDSYVFEDRHYKEDTQKMIELVNLRSSMWT